MTITQCAACGRDVIGSDDTESYCPDCAGEHVSGHTNHGQQARDHAEQRSRQRVIDNAANQGGEL